MIYFIYGPDRLLARNSALSIIAELDPDGLDTTWLDGRETSLERIIAAIGTVSFFAAPRVVVVSDFLARGNREPAASDAVTLGDERQPRGHPELGPLLAAVPSEHCLILLEPSLTALPAAIKTASGAVTIIGSEPPRGAALVAWIEGSARRAGATIDRRTAQHLAMALYPQTWDRVPNNPRFDRPPDMALIAQEVEKLALAAHPEAITAEHVRQLVPGGADHRVFRFLDAALSGDLRSAIMELERLNDAGEEPAVVLAQVLGQVELGAVAAAAGGKDPGAVARDLGSIAPARMSAIMSSSGRQPSRRFASLTSAVSADRRLKTGRMRWPVDALYDLVLALGERTAPHDDGRST